MFVVFKLQPLRVIFTQQMIMIPSLLPNRLNIQEKAQISYRKIQKLHFSLCICMSVHAQSLQSCPTLCDTMDRARQAALFMGFSRQEYWSGLPCPPPGNLPDPGMHLLQGRWIFYHWASHWGSPYLHVVWVVIATHYICTILLNNWFQGHSFQKEWRTRYAPHLQV